LTFKSSQKRDECWFSRCDYEEHPNVVQNIMARKVAAICWSIWKYINKVCFDLKSLRSPAEIVIHACALMSYWAGLYGSELHDKILVGVKLWLSALTR